jgi:hypothetical protein
VPFSLTRSVLYSWRLLDWPQPSPETPLEVLSLPVMEEDSEAQVERPSGVSLLCLCGDDSQRRKFLALFQLRICFLVQRRVASSAFHWTEERESVESERTAFTHSPPASHTSSGRLHNTAVLRGASLPRLTHPLGDFTLTL